MLKTCAGQAPFSFAPCPGVGRQLAQFLQHFLLPPPAASTDPGPGACPTHGGEGLQGPWWAVCALRIGACGGQMQLLSVRGCFCLVAFLPSWQNSQVQVQPGLAASST